MMSDFCGFVSECFSIPLYSALMDCVASALVLAVAMVGP